MSARLQCGPRRALALALGLVIGLASGGGVAAQTPWTNAGAGLRYEYYSFASPAAAGASSATLLSLPFAARVAIAPGLTLGARGAVARGRVVGPVSTSTLAGLTDTELRATLTAGRPSTTLALAAVAMLPSGHGTLSEVEAGVAGLVASDLLPFGISNWGAGGGGAFDISAVQAVGQGSVGLSAMYRLARAFQPLERVAQRYRPGDELRLGAAAQIAEDDNTLSLQLSYSRFGEDQLGGVGLLRTGHRLLGLGMYSAPRGTGTVSGYAGMLYRSGGALGDAYLRLGLPTDLAAPPSEILLLAGSSARVPWRARVLVPGLDVRLLRRNDGTNQGLIVGIGAAAELPVGERGVRVVPSARLRVGRLLVAEGVASRVTGFELGVAVDFGGAR